MFVLTDSQQVKLTLKGQSAAGNEAPLENIVVTSSDESIVTVTKESDDSFILSSTGAVGTSQIQVTADARIGAGESEISGVETISVVSGEAIQIGLSFDDPMSRI